MDADADTPAMHDRLIEALYLETMLLADEARDYAENRARTDAVALDAATGVVLACESLRLTTRLMHLLGWLLAHRAIAAGEGSAEPRSTCLTPVAETDMLVLARLPDEAATLIATGEMLYRRGAKIDAAMVAAGPWVSPARALQQRLAIDLRG